MKCPCFNMVFAKNCAKGPKPIMPILRALCGTEDVEIDMVADWLVCMKMVNVVMFLPTFLAIW